MTAAAGVGSWLIEMGPKGGSARGVGWEIWFFISDREGYWALREGSRGSREIGEF